MAVLVELAAGAPVVDLGCVPGHVTEHLRALGACAAGSLLALPLGSSSVAAVACLYVVIHLSAPERDAAYAELARLLRPGGHALVASHVSDDAHPAGSSLELAAAPPCWSAAPDRPRRCSSRGRPGRSG